MKKNMFVVTMLVLALMASFFWAGGADQVQAMYAVDSTGASHWSTFMIKSPTVSKPEKFTKLLPKDGTYNLPIVQTLRWTSLKGDASYYYCLDTTNNDTCDTAWEYSPTNSVTVYLNERQGYSWQVRADVAGTWIYANGSEDAWWIFGTVGTWEP